MKICRLKMFLRVKIASFYLMAFCQLLRNLVFFPMIETALVFCTRKEYPRILKYCAGLDRKGQEICQLLKSPLEVYTLNVSVSFFFFSTATLF